MATEVDREKPDLLDEEPEQIADRASDVGRERLDRTNADILITGLIGGAEVSLGGLAAMAVTGSALAAVPDLPLYAALALGGLAFPIGFLFVIVGRSELFTENFLIPVVAVFNGERPVGSLLEMWGFSWVGNLAGCAALSIILSQPHAIGDPILGGYRAYAEYKLGLPLLSVFYSATLAGMAMTVLTWLLLSVRDTLGKMVAIFGAGYLLFAANLSHSIVGSSLLFVGFGPAGRSLGEVIVWELVATAGNLVGGVGFVTLFRIVQAREKARPH
jgi:formate/nitrite transporter FocA (FNT family)